MLTYERKTSRVTKIPQSADQIRARKENFLIFQLKGAVGNLSQQKFRLAECETSYALVKTIIYLDRAISSLIMAEEAIKEGQKERREKKCVS